MEVGPTAQNNQRSDIACQTSSREVDIDAIDGVLEEYIAAANRGDVEGWSATFAEDAIYLPPNQAEVNGKEAIRSWVVNSFFDPFDIQLSASSQEVEVAGDWAFARGTYNLSLTPKAGGQVIEDSGKFIDILRRQPDSNWKFDRIIYNSNRPLSGEYTHLLQDRGQSGALLEKLSREFAYCVKCRAKREMINAQKSDYEKWRPAMKGRCSTCGTGMYKILSSK